MHMQKSWQRKEKHDPGSPTMVSRDVMGRPVWTAEMGRQEKNLWKNWKNFKAN